MSSHRGAGALHADEPLPPTPVTPNETQTGQADVSTDVAEGVTDASNVRLIGPIESVFLRGRGNNLNADTSTQAIGLVLTQTSPWPMTHEEGDPDSRHGSAERVTQQLNAAIGSAAEDLHPRRPGNRTRSPSRAPDPVPPTEIVSIEHFRLLNARITALEKAQVENVNETAWAGSRNPEDGKWIGRDPH